MKSRYLTLADEQMEVASTPVERARVEARKATYLARQGERHGAMEIVARLRRQYSQSPDATVSAFLHLTEGLLDFFEDLSPAASAKILRALALASAAKIARVEALSAAWLAHLAFSAHRLGDLRANLVRSFATASEDDHDALSRASSVCAVSLHLAGDVQGAKRWYRAARLHGLEVGDDATVSSCLHNFVAMSAMNLRQAVLTGVGRGREDFDLLLSGAQSAANYDELIGAVSLDKLLPTVRAYVHSLTGEPVNALLLYGKEALAARAQGMERMAPWFLADMSWCQLRVGSGEESQRLAQEAEESLKASQGVQVDDLAAAHSRLSDVFGELGDADRSALHATAAQEAWSRFQCIQEELLSIMKDVETRFGSSVRLH